ncbi:MAG: 50S ribosomal protein L25 [Candidatus Peregrinibacteria bacterium]|nr:50S ribosomal protein L25 [Candidatus Peregrinibacteria bacterium]
MEAITIEVSKGRFDSAKEARRAGEVPMVYYAKEVEPIQFTANYQDFRRAYRKAGKSTIITLVDETNEEYPVIVHEVQYGPVSDEIIHVDLKAIKKGQKIQTEIPLVFVGESAAVRELGGTLMHSKDKVAIECLPKDLPHEIEVDISPLTDFHASLTVGDIKVSEEIAILDAEDISIATVIAPRTEEEPVEAAESEAAAEEGATAEGGEEKKEGSAEGGEGSE